MTPLQISKELKTMSNSKLAQQIKFLSYTFCVNADFTKTEYIQKLIDSLNKVYEQVELIFDDQPDAISSEKN